MGKHLAKIQSGLQHFKQWMTRSKPTVPVRRQSIVMSMVNPLDGRSNPGPPQFNSARQRQVAEAASVLYSNQSAPQNHVPAIHNHAPANPPTTRFYDSMPPLNNPLNPPRSATPSPYSSMNEVAIIQQAPPPSMLASLKQTVINPNKMEVESDQKLNHSLEHEITDWNPGSSKQEAGPLYVQSDLKLYEDFLELEKLRTPNPEAIPGLKALASGDYGLEAMTQWHKSAHLMTLLIMYYRKHYYEVNKEASFSEVVTSLNESDLARIWGCKNDLEGAEFIRRFLQGVRYLTPEKREKYNVETKGGIMYWAKWGAERPLDTTSPDFFKRKHQDTPHLGKDNIAIWVMSKEGKLYTHPAKIHRFHHSSFTSGDMIRCAGDWEVREGKLMWVSAMSGHYCPTFDNLKDAVQRLANNYGVSLMTFKVKLFHKDFGKAKEQVMVPAKDFIYDFNRVKNTLMLV